MTHKVQIKPGGWTFIVETHDSILAGAIRAGVSPDYGCSNGNCGLCKARIVSGDIAPLKHSDFVIPKEEKLQGYTLLCCNTAASDLVIEAAVASSAEDIPLQEIPAKVRKLEAVSDNVMIMQVRTPRTQRLRFLAGQYATIMTKDSPAYDSSIASCPCNDMLIEFHIRREAEEPFSEHVFAKLKVGDWIDIEGPKGDFIVHEDSVRPLLLIAFDTGFAAIKSLLENETAQDDERRIKLYWLACKNTGQYLSNLCRSWADALDEFQYMPLIIDAEYAELQRNPEKGKQLASHEIEKIVHDTPDLSDFDAYFCVPAPLQEIIETILCDHGLMKGRMKMEFIRGNQNISCIPSKNDAQLKAGTGKG